MSFAQILEELPKLTHDERQQLIERMSELDGETLSPAEDALIEARLAEHDRNPGSARLAGEVIADLRARFTS